MDPGNTSAHGSAPAVAPPPVAATPAPAAWVTDDGSFAEGWTKRLGPDYENNATLLSTKGLKPLVDSHLELRKMVGKKFIRPGEGSTEQEVAEWRKLVGSPDSAEAYGALMPEGFDKDSWDTELEKSFAALAHAEHLPPDTAKKIAAFHATAQKAAAEKQVADFKAGLDAQEAELKKEWGAEYPRHEANFKALAAYFGFPPDHDMFLMPGVKKAFAEKAQTVLGGDKVVHGQPVGIVGGTAEQIEAIRKSDDYQGKTTPERQMAAHQRMISLYEAQAAAGQRAA